MKLDTLIALTVSGGGGPVSPNMFIAKLTAEGEPLALQSAGVIGNQFYGEILVRGDGRLYFAGLNEGVAVKKSSLTETKSVAFVGYKEHGIVERTGPVELEFSYQETICLGDSIQFRSSWYKEAGTYRDTAHNPIGIDSIFILQLTTRGNVFGIGRSPLRIEIKNEISGVNFEDAFNNREFIELEGQLRIPIISVDDLFKNKSATGRTKDRADLEELRKFLG